MDVNDSIFIYPFNSFHSTAWDLDELNDKWIKIVLKVIPLFTIDDEFISVGDGVKAAKDGRHMPGNKKQHQESETQSKPISSCN